MKFVPHYHITHRISKVIDKSVTTFDSSTLGEGEKYNETDSYVTIFEKIVVPDISTTFDLNLSDVEVMDTNEKAIRYMEKVSIGDKFMLVAFPYEKNYNPYFNHEYFREDKKLYEFRFFIKGEINDILNKNDETKIKFKIEEIIPFFYRKNTCLNIINDFVLEPSHIVKFDNERFDEETKKYFDEEDSSTFKISNTNLKHIDADSNGDVYITLNEQLCGSKMRLSFSFDGTETNYYVAVNRKL